MHPRVLKSVATPIFLQMETVDCGAAALGSVLAYFGRHVPLSELRSACLVSRDGVSVANLVKAAHHFGLEATVHQTISEQSSLPVILFWNHKHYLVLEGIKKNKLYVNDPQKGRQVIDWKTYHQHFSKVVIQFKVKPDFKKNNQPKSSIKKLFCLLLEQKRPVAILCAAMFFLSLLNLTPLIFTKLFIDQLAANLGLQGRSALLLIMSLLFSLQFLIAYHSRKLFRFLETRFATTLSTKLIHHLLNLPLPFFAHRRAGDLLHRVQAADRLAGAPWSALCLMSTAIFQGSISFILMLIFSPLLSAIALIVMFIYFLLVTYSQKKWQYSESILKARMKEVSVFTFNCLSMMTQIKSQCSEKNYFEKWREHLKNYLATHHQFSIRHQLLHILTQSTFSLGYISILSVGIYLVSHNKMSLGELMACQILFLSLNEALAQRMRFTMLYDQIEADLQSIADITESKIESRAFPKQINHSRKLGKIELLNLTFGYSQEFKPLLRELHLTIASRTQVVIVGRSGSGKSTLVHLISGLYQPWAGKILIDDIPLSHYAPAGRARMIGVVGQQQFFFKGSIKDNLCLWDRSYSHTEIMEALELACIDELVRQTTDGLDYQLLEGASNISGGQKQRLEIARTLLAKPQILLLDEATCSLDPLIENQIKKNLAHYSATKIWFTHQHYPTQDADNLFILDQGQLMTENSLKSLSA